MFEGLGFFDLLMKGGPTVWVLGLFSLISITIMLERAWTYRNFRASLGASYSALKSKVGSGATPCSEAEPSALARVYSSGYASRQEGRDEVLRSMELAGRSELASLERYVGIIGTIGSTAPFIGLFGTVLGIIHAFGEMGGIGAAGPAAVADGIAEALVATAAGLFVAVPAVIAYNYFVRAAARNALELEARAAEFVAPILRSASNNTD
ncbi:MAG: MotA/TolQ/ExbB proton channel family protein [Proteobacteria bacterium]|nr:MotA/TolQ/ExbB proton channel family protein [Pseudomonadota bacterium]